MVRPIRQAYTGAIKFSASAMSKFHWAATLLRRSTTNLITDMQQLTVYLETHTQVGDTIDAKILRNGEESTIRITLEERPPPQ